MSSPYARRRKRYKPSLVSLCKIGTIAHNRPFNARDMREYSEGYQDTKETPQRIKWLLRNKLIQVADKRHAGGGATYSPTAKGWKMIERACKLYRDPPKYMRDR